MILQALVQYYEQLVKEHKVPPMGWAKANVSYALDIGTDGQLLQIYTLMESRARGKKVIDVPRLMTVPQPLKRSSGIAPQFLYDNAAYLLGIDGTKPERARQCFVQAKCLHEDLLKPYSGTAAEAIKRFFASWNPETAREHQAVAAHWEGLVKGGGIIFFVNGRDVMQDAELTAAWNGRKRQDEAVVMQCLVTGEQAPIARLHPSIKGVRGAQSSGASLVSFNAPAYESYGHDGEQGINAPVSEYAAFAYSTALNYLLSGEMDRNAQCIGDMTIVYWAERQCEAYQNAFSEFLFAQRPDEEGMSDEVLRSVFDDIKRQGWFDYKGLRMEYTNPFYILGLSPNAARLSVRCFLAGTFGCFMIHISNHMERMAIVKPFFETGECVSLWALLQETVSPKSQHKAVSPALAGSVLQAILTDQAYPEALYQAIILRIHADQGPGKVNYRRAAFIKAYLIKNKGRNMTVGLNEASTDRAYVLGRLFAVLEYVQYKYDSKINTTIKDSYFDSACTQPAVVFPVLLKLANHHLAKLRKEKAGIARDMDRLICSLLKTLPGGEQVIPMHVSLSKQGEFILGYYHQREVLLARHNKEEA